MLKVKAGSWWILEGTYHRKIVQVQEHRTSLFQILTQKQFLADHIPSTLFQPFQICPTKAGNSLEKRAE